MSDLDKFRSEQLQDPEYRAYHEEMQAAADLSKVIVGARLQQGMSQKDLAKRTGMTQSEISRIESCDANPSLKTLKRIAAGLNMRLQIEFVPLHSDCAED